MDRSTAPDAGYTAKREAVIALRKNARQVGGQGVGRHHPARPRRIPDKENGQAAQHAPVRSFGSAGLDKKLYKSRRFALEELLLSKPSEPRRTIGEQGLPFSNGKPVPIHISILFPRARGGEPCVACEELRGNA